MLFQPGMTARYQPQIGDYWVVYEGDNYEAISPRGAFEAGYIPIPDWRHPPNNSD